MMLRTGQNWMTSSMSGLFTLAALHFGVPPYVLTVVYAIVLGLGLALIASSVRSQLDEPS